MDESGFMHLFGAKWVRYAMQYAGGWWAAWGKVAECALVAAGWSWGRGFKCESAKVRG